MVRVRLFFFALALAPAGCHKHDGPAAAEPEEKTAQVTVWHERYEISLRDRSAVRHGEALPTLLAAGGENLPAALGAHAVAETVRLDLVSVVRLERALHGA